jgi:membrane protease YdiL (CAAX protease family)
LKILAITVAVTAGFCEETIFRKLLMDALQNRGFGILLQLVASAVAFGVAHAVWGLFRGSIVAALRVIWVIVWGYVINSPYDSPRHRCRTSRSEILADPVGVL